MEIENKEQNESNLWQYMFYAGMATLTIWLILKVTGIIQTPIWLEYGVPIASLIVSLFGFYKHLANRINKVEVGLATVNVRFDHLDRDVESIKKILELIKKNIM